MGLIQQIAEMSNLREAFLKASRGKRGKREVVRFRAGLQRNLLKLREGLLSGELQIGDYHYFTVHDPKERVICAAAFPERVLHHAIMNICAPILERASIYDSYACREGKGQYACMERAQHFCRGNAFYLKLDVRKYFDSIHHSTLLGMLDAKFQDPCLATLFKRLVGTYHTQPDSGLPIGNLCSQHFANFYLGKLDRYVKETLKCRSYLRYMDDFVLWHDDPNWLKKAWTCVTAFAEDTLKLTLKPPVLGKTKAGLNLVGFRILPFYRLLSGRSKRRYIRKRRELDAQLDAGNISETEAAIRYASLDSFACHARISGLRLILAVPSQSKRPVAPTA
jgi:RNA-directed DNA polymerase